MRLGDSLIIRGLLFAIVHFATSAYAQLPGVSFTIRFDNGTSQFRVGEPIPIELSFSSSIPDAYDLRSKSYDRSGRMSVEEFHVSPPGRDPLEKYFASGIFIAGGLESNSLLQTKPQLMHEDLNEWVVIEKPGHYSVYITTSRISPVGTRATDPFTTRSNMLEFDVIAADPVWQQSTLLTTVTVLDDPATSEDDRLKALRKLRVLDIPASIHELVRQFASVDPGHDFDVIAGLAGSLDQDLVIRELEDQIRDAQTPITSAYVYLLEKLKTQRDDPPSRIPTEDLDRQHAIQMADRKFREQSERINAIYRQVAAAFPLKQGSARTVTLKTMIDQATSMRSQRDLLSHVSQTDLTTAFSNMSPRDQAEMLGTRWSQFKFDGMIPVLRTLSTRPSLQQSELRDLAIRRLFELSPSDATPLILNEIRNPHVNSVQNSTMRLKTLSLLPNKTLPQFDQLLVTRLQTKNSPTVFLDAGLIGRYATDAILPQVKTFYGEGKQWDCDIVDGIAHYFLRYDPDYAVGRLLEARVGCMEGSVPELKRLKRFKPIEQAIIASLQDTDPYRAGAAANSLQRVGDADAEKALWKRMAQFHQQWQERQDELVVTYPVKNRKASDASGLQYQLIEALLHGAGWVLTNEQITELEGLALGEGRKTVSAEHWTSPVTLVVASSDESDLLFSVNNDQFPLRDLPSLIEKLRQYPGGTPFKVLSGVETDALAPILQTLRDASIQYRFSLEDPN